MDLKRMEKAGRSIRYLGVCIFVLVSAVAFGQAKFTTVIDQSTISRDQLVQVEYIVENAKKVDDFDPPSFRNFAVIQGPIQSSGMSFVNGALTQYKAIVFLLQPRTTGKLIIPGAMATIDGKRRQSDAVALEVTKSQNAGSSQRTRLRLNLRDASIEADKEFVLYPNENAIEKIRKNLFVRVEVSKKNCYVNEPVVATYKLYSRLRSESRVVKRPSYNGFSVYDMSEPNAGNPAIETVDGKQYNVHIIRKSQLFPLQAGEFVLEPVEVENTVHFIKAPTEEDNYLEEMNDPFAETVQHTVVLGSNPVNINVKSLPNNNQPQGFDGAVGNFSVRASLKDPIVKAGEAGNLIVEVKGKGNIPMINAPTVNWPDKFEVFDPNTKEEVQPENAPLSGTKTFAFPFTAKDTGSLIIPPIKFSFFDPISQSYKTDSTRAISLRIMPGAKKVKGSSASKVRNIIPNPPTARMWLWIAGGAIGTLLLITIVFLRNRSAHKKNVNKPSGSADQLNQQVIPVKPDPLEKARRMLSSSNSTMFVKEVEAVVWNELGEKLKIPPSALNQPHVINSLQRLGADESAIQQFRQVMHDCEYALYIPGQSNEDLEAILINASLFLDKLNELP
ncbi:MAG TPA: BatD family protein [Chitinophagaceae bacterium]